MANYDPAAYGAVWAEHYDRVFNAAGTGSAAEIAACIARLTAGEAVLELGIGTGRVALALRELGVDVSGVDASTAMVDRLRAKPGGADIPVTIGDFSGPLPPGPAGGWATIVLVFNTLFALPSQEAQLACFRHVAAALRPGGAFVIECFVPDPARLHPPFLPRTEVSDDGAVRLFAMSADALHQTIRTTAVVFEGDRALTLPVPVLRYAWPDELDLMARLAGLELHERHADWEGAPLTVDSPRHVSVYRRPPTSAG
jgi:SAM-dependent methyltransferase